MLSSKVATEGLMTTADKQSVELDCTHDEFNMLSEFLEKKGLRLERHKPYGYELKGPVSSYSPGSDDRLVTVDVVRSQFVLNVTKASFMGRKLREKFHHEYEECEEILRGIELLAPNVVK